MLTGATAKTTSVDIAWTNPSDPDFDHVEISWSLNGVPMNMVRVGKGIMTYSITGLVASTEYSITLVTVDTDGNRSALPSRFSIVTSSGADQAYHFIYTVADLNAVHGGVAGYASWGLSGNYILMADLDLNVPPYNTGAGWAPIGNDTTPFTGIFNGNTHSISRLFIDNSSLMSSSGFFGRLSGAFIYHLNLLSVTVAGGNGLAGYSMNSTITNCSVTGSITGSGALIGYAGNSTITRCSATASVAGGTYSTGGLVGYADNSTLANCSATVSVTGDSRTGGLVGTAFQSTLTACSAAGPVIGTEYTGGLVGQTISASVTDCSASGVVTSGGDYAGGLVGYSESSILTRCFATGAVSGSVSVYVGGLVGYNYYSWLSDCYARGSVTGATMVGGLVGMLQCRVDYAYVLRSYATGYVSEHGDAGDNGGLVGYDWYGNDISVSYYDLNTTGQSVTGKGDPRTTSQMKLIDTSVTTYQSWDFINTWSIDGTGVINNGYPYLRNNHP